MYAANNIFYNAVATPGDSPSIFEFSGDTGNINFSPTNWVSPGWLASESAELGTSYDGTITGTSSFFVDPNNNPGFVNLSGEGATPPDIYQLVSGSNAIGIAGTNLSRWTTATGWPGLPTEQFVPPSTYFGGSGTARTSVADVWAYQAGHVTPTVSSETPASGAANVAVSTAPTATFSEPVQANTISFVLSGPHGTTVSGIVSYSSTTDTATFTPSGTLAGSTSYTARASGAKTQSGTAMASPVTWTFTTPTTTVPTAPATTVPVVTISSVQSVLKIKNRRVVTQVLITFSGAINTGEAHLLRFYRLTIAGKDGSFTARNARAVRLQSAVYDTANKSVALTSSEPFSLAKPPQLIIFGKPPSGLKDDLGRFIDGGTNVVAILSRSGITITQ